MNYKEEIQKIIDEKGKKSCSRAIKNDKILWNEIVSKTSFITSNNTMERVNAYLQDLTSLKCKNGNSLKYRDGNFVFCGKANTCLCNKQQVSKNIKEIKSKRSKEDIEKENKKREQTIFEKSNGEYTNNGQSKDAKQKHFEFYNDVEKVKNQTLKQQKTMFERYGSNNSMKVDIFKVKVKETCLKKYNVDNYKQSHISKENLNILQSKKLLEKIYSIYGAKETSKILGVDVSLINRKVKFFNIRKNIKYQNESQIFDFLMNTGISNIQLNSRSIINNFELDLFLPDYNVAIEHNGMYWHSTKFKDKNYHLNKMKLCNDKNISLFQINEYEWNTNSELIKSRIENFIFNRYSSDFDIKVENNTFLILLDKEIIGSGNINEYVTYVENSNISISIDKLFYYFNKPIKINNRYPVRTNLKLIKQLPPEIETSPYNHEIWNCGYNIFHSIKKGSICFPFLF